MNSNRSIIFTLFILFLILYLGTLQLYVLANLSLLICCLFAYLYKPDLIVSLFVVLLPTNGIFTTEANIFGIFGPYTIPQFFAFLVFFTNRQIFNKELSIYSKSAVLFVVVLFFYACITEFRNAYFQIYDVSWSDAFKRFIKYFFRFGALFLLVLNLNLGYYYRIVTSSIVIGVLLLIFSSVFTSQLRELSFLTTDASEFLSSYETIERKSGFFGQGDVNSLGAILSSYLGFLIVRSYFYLNKFYNYVLIFITLLGILFTGSRSAMISTALIFVLYLMLKNPRNNLHSNKILLFVALLISFFVLYYLFEDQVNFIIQRFNGAEDEASSQNEASRLFKWLYYLNDIALNPTTLFIGTNHELAIVYSSGFKELRVPHNLFISILFNSGLVVLLVFVALWYRILKISFNNRYFFLIIFPIFSISIYVSDWGSYMYFIIFVSLFSFIEKELK